MGSLHPDRLVPLLETAWVGRDYRFLEAVDSTNDALRSLVEREGVEERMEGGAVGGLVVAADVQRQGRGRRGRTWLSPAGENLMFSLLVRPQLAPGRLPPLSLVAGVGVAHALAPFLGAPPVVKWPNDLLWEQRKLCGILAELSADGERVRYVIVGIGINVNQLEFAPELAETATSLRRVRGRAFERAEVFAAVLLQLERWLDAALAGKHEEVLAEWQRLATWLGSDVAVAAPNGTLRGRALGLDPTGALRLVTANGIEHRVLAGDVIL